MKALRQRVVYLRRRRFRVADSIRPVDFQGLYKMFRVF